MSSNILTIFIISGLVALVATLVYFLIKRNIVRKDKDNENAIILKSSIIIENFKNISFNETLDFESLAIKSKKQAIKNSLLFSDHS